MALFSGFKGTPTVDHDKAAGAGAGNGAAATAAPHDNRFDQALDSPVFKSVPPPSAPKAGLGP